MFNTVDTERLFIWIGRKLPAVMSLHTSSSGVRSLLWLFNCPISTICLHYYISNSFVSWVTYRVVFFLPEVYRSLTNISFGYKRNLIIRYQIFKPLVSLCAQKQTSEILRLMPKYHKKRAPVKKETIPLLSWCSTYWIKWRGSYRQIKWMFSLSPGQWNQFWENFRTFILKGH